MLLLNKADRFFGPTTTNTIQHLLDADTRMPLTQDCSHHHWLIQQLDIIIALVRLILAYG